MLNQSPTLATAIAPESATHAAGPHLRVTSRRANLQPAHAGWLSRIYKTLIWLCLLVLVLLGASQAWAQNTITGTIASSTTLRAAQSPYTFQGDVVVDNNATLSIEPGVTVKMAAAASFTVKRGALQAVGSPDKPIKITSAAATPAAGDWRQWRFAAGTNNALTQLGYVTIEYGSGLAIEGAAPVINNTAINNHSGPAITIDLASSPLGTGNTANGNSLNAISVPAGTIRNHVVWGVVGIPYLVQQGLVNIGQAPLALEPAKLKLSPGVVAMLRVTLNASAPAGGVSVDVSSSVPSVASAVSRVTVLEGQANADLEIQANSLGTTKVTASHASLGTAETQIEVVNLPSLGLAPASPTVGVNRSYPMTLSLPAPAASNVSVQLSNADSAIVSAPSSLVVPAGMQSINFEVTGLVDGVSRLTAQAEGYASALATVTVRGKALVLPSSVVVAPGGSTSVTLEATEPAPVGGLSVALALAQSGLAKIPATVQIPEGQSKASFEIEGQALGTTSLTASAGGYHAAQTTLRVDAISLNTDPSADLVMNAELSRTVRVQLNKAAPQGGITVAVSSQDASIAAVSPAEVFIPQGQIYATTPVTVKALAEGKTAISISSPGLIAKTLKVDVRQKFALRLGRDGGGNAVVGKGLYSYYLYEVYVQRLVNGAASSGADAVTVHLRCVSEDICKVPATVTIPAGQSYVYFSVTGVDVGSSQIVATAEGTTEAAPLAVDVITPTLVFNSLDGNRTTSSVRDNFSISFRVPGSRYPNEQRAATALTVNVSPSDQEPEGIVNGIYNSSGNLITQMTVAAGGYATGTAYVAQPVTAGSYRIAASIADIVTAKSDLQTVTAADQSLKLGRNGGGNAVVGKGLYSYYTDEVYVQRYINGVASSGGDAVTVSLRCVSEEICKVPATVTIPAGQSYVYFSVTGVDVGSSQIVATAEGMTAATPLPVDVITPTLVFKNLDGIRSTSSVRDDFTISLTVPGSRYPEYQRAVTALMVNLSLSDQDPEGVVNGIYNSAGNLITQLTVGAGSYATGTAYVAQPATAGSYRIAASIAGIVSAKSDLQTVNTAEQSLKLGINAGGNVVVGKGLYTYYQDEVYVQRFINGVASAGADAVTVALRCESEDICKVPATVTIPAGQSFVYFSVTGVDVGSSNILATAQGTTDAKPLPVNVIEPTVLFKMLDGNRTTASVRDDFVIALRVPGSRYADYQRAAEALTVNISLSDQDPEGVVNGFYNAAGSLVTQLIIAKGRSETETAYVAQPVTAGTYRVKADVMGVTSALSDVQNVVDGKQGIRLVRAYGTKLTVGKGLNTYIEEIYVQRLINGGASSGADAITVNLRCLAPEVCSVPATVTIPANQGYIHFRVTGVDVGSTQIEATAAGRVRIFV